MRLLVTRPELQAEQTAAALRAQGHEVLLASLLRIETIADADLGLGPWAAVVMTSANAARAIASHAQHAELAALPVFAVGARTAEAARAAGFAQVESADGDVTELASVLGDRLPESCQILYLSGPDRAGVLTGMLAEAGVAVRTVVVYRAVAEGWLPAEVADALAGGEIDGVLHFSRRSAKAFVSAAADAEILNKSLMLKHYCLSSQVAEPLAQAGARQLLIAPRPDEEALFELIDLA